MRSLCFSVLSMAVLSGCTTVSVIPVERMITAQFSERGDAGIGANTYVAQARERRWVRKNPGVFGITPVFVNTFGEAPAAYLAWIKTGQHDWSGLVDTLVVDIELATTGLNAINGKARARLENEEQPEGLRSDITDFEKAVMVAQASRSSFVGALDYLTKNRPDDSQLAVDMAILGRLDAAIESAKTTVDRLAAAWRAPDRGVAPIF